MAQRFIIQRFLSVSTLLLAVSPTSFKAQMHRVAAPENVTRALGVYEWTGEMAKPAAARLIPVSLFINGHFEDAGVYLAHPIPFVLQTGNVYSIERAGESIGTLDLDFARNIISRRSGTDDNAVSAWFGYGRFLTPAEEARLTKAARPSSKTPVVVASSDPDSGDDRPRFIRRESTDSSKPATPSASGTPSKTTSPSPTTSPAPDDDPDRPTLRHRDPAEETNTKKNNKVGGYVSPPNTSLNDDPDRPTIRRGVPAEAVTTSQLTGMPPGLHQAVAVSDPANHQPHAFTREWATSTERAEIMGGIQNLAMPRLAKYIADNRLTPASAAKPATAATAAKPTASTAARSSAHTIRRPAPKPAPPAITLANEQISGYTLSYGGLATFIYTVEVPLADGGPVYLTMVAQHLPSGELQVALSSVTDANHMDRTPWMRPVDVVDPDWSHRASLLFELRGQSTRQFALYRLIAAQAEQTFVTGLID